MPKYISEVTKGAAWTETNTYAPVAIVPDNDGRLVNREVNGGEYSIKMDVERKTGQRFSHPSVKHLKQFIADIAAHGGEAIRVQ